MTPLAATPRDILDFLMRNSGSEAGAVLVTLVGIDGSSPREIGAQMAVSADGRHCGSFSGGCIEAAIVAEALDILASGEGRIVRFGRGSSYIDIRLPCGGGIDLLFTPRPDRKAVADVLAALDRRQPATLALPCIEDVAATSDAPPLRDGQFTISYMPPLRIVAIGQGEILVAAGRLAQLFGTDLIALSPSRGDVDELAAQGIDARLLAHPSTVPDIQGDPWTAFTLLFHDHDWEDRLLPWALGREHLIVSAIGGARTRDRRLARLHALGFDSRAIEAFKSPAGLIPAARDPATLALSVVSQIVAAYQAKDHPSHSASRADDMAGAAVRSGREPHRLPAGATEPICQACPGPA